MPPLVHSRHQNPSNVGQASTSQEPLRCAICDDLADGQHFGADSCRACAAFFRRTISRKLKYVCRFDGDCDIVKDCRALCRACRLEKCLVCGMNATAVRSECVEIVRPPKVSQRKQLEKQRQHVTEDNCEPLPLPAPIPLIPQGDAVYVWEDGIHETHTESAGSSSGVDVDSSYGSNASTSSWPRTPLSNISNEPPARASLLHDIVEVKACEYIVDDHQLPPTHPTLMKMLMAYEGIQKRRDERFNRNRDCDGVPCRIYTQVDKFDLLTYYQMTQAELPHIAEMLNLFDGYKELPHEDKVVIFRHYWIYFVILERNFDTYRVLGGNLEDRQIVFPNGNIVDVIHCDYDVSKVTDVPLDDIRRLIHPWYKTSAEELIQPVKRLGPTDLEMMFCLGLMLWQFSAELSAQLSHETVQKAEQMVEHLYNELHSYYKHMVSVDNVVRRVSELMRFVSLTERIVMFRREDIILARTFLTFKVDIFMEDLFDKA